MKRINQVTDKPFRRGDKDSQGNSFWCYQKNMLSVDGYFKELWIPKEKVLFYETNLANGYKKTCSKCGETKIVKDNFYKKLSSEDGFDPWCNECFLHKNRNWISKNKSRHQELTTRWYDENTEKQLENSKKVYQKNKPRKLLDYYRREERIARATPSWVDKKDLLKIYKQAEKITKTTGIPHEVDHIHPLVHKLICGLNVPWNLQIITAKENRRKANKIDLKNLNL